MEDLPEMRSDWVEPLALEVFGLTGWTVPPNSQGYLTLAAAWVFERLNPPDDPEHPDFIHLLIEAYRAVAWAREWTWSFSYTRRKYVSTVCSLMPNASAISLNR